MTTTPNISSELASFLEAIKEREEQQQSRFKEALNEVKPLLTEQGYEASIEWQGGGDSGDFYDLAITKNGEEVKDEKLEETFENLADYYIQAFHPGCEISDGEADGSQGTITFNKDGVSDDFTYNHITKEDASTSVGW